MNWGEIAAILWNSMFVVPFVVGVVVFETDMAKKKKIGCTLLFSLLINVLLFFLGAMALAVGMNQDPF
jgi:hypothetical protein